jgi:hypothetical protein
MQTSFGSARGYRLAECQDAFKRYVPAAEPDETVNVKTHCDTSPF